jgi:hypothetical protein
MSTGIAPTLLQLRFGTTPIAATVAQQNLLRVIIKIIGS